MEPIEFTDFLFAVSITLKKGRQLHATIKIRTATPDTSCASAIAKAMVIHGLHKRHIETAYAVCLGPAEPPPDTDSNETP